MKYKEISGLSAQELLDKERNLKEQLHKLNYQRYAGRVEKPHTFSVLKKDIARIKTALRLAKAR
ncbi:50S ribosomal protein L29 [bacterium]|nr:MAG: 50S ribosomal protein L29 [bacterium]